MLITLGQKSQELCQELCQVIKQMSERQELLAALMECRTSLQKEAPETFHEQMFLRRSGLVGKEAQAGKIEERKGECQGSGGRRDACGGRCRYRYYKLFSFSLG